MSRPGILLVSARTWPSQGGIQQFLRRVARELARTRPVRIAALVNDDRPMTRSLQHAEVPEWEPFRDGGVEVTPIRLLPGERGRLRPLAVWRGRVPAPAYRPVRALSAAFYPRAIGPALERAAEGMGMIHVFGGDMLGLAAARAATSAAVPLVVTPFAHRGAWGDDAPNRRLYRGAGRVLALLDTEAEWYREMGVAADRIRVTGLWTELAPPGNLPAAIAGDAPMVLFLGVRRRYKGYDRILAAAPQVWATRPDTLFVFAGPGDVPAGAQPDPRVIQLGPVDEATKAALLARATLLCLPSESEILPTVILEAWMSGRPVVAAAIPTVSELVGEGGELVGANVAELTGAILRLLENPDLAARRAAAGSARLEAAYNVEAVMAEIESAYRELAGGSPS